MAEPRNLGECAVLLASHGSPTADAENLPSQRLAERVRGLGLFARVEHGFLEQAPDVREVLDDMSDNCVFVVPVMACNGYIAQTKLPKRLGLTGAITERLGANGRQQIVLTPPLGTEAGIAPLIFDLLQTAFETLKLDATGTTALIVGHGSARSCASKEQTEALVRAIEGLGFKPTIKSAFLEEPPKIEDWRDLTDSPTVLVMAVMISDGHHGTIDVPMALGIEAGPDFQVALSQGIAGPFQIDGRRIFMLAPLGEAPQLADVVVSNVRNKV